NVYPTKHRTTGTTAGYSGPADLAQADLWTTTRARDRTRHPGNVGERAARRAWRSLSRPPAAGRARLDLREVGSFFQQPQGAVLCADGSGPQTTGQRNQQMETIDRGNRADSRGGKGEKLEPCPGGNANSTTSLLKSKHTYSSR